jgi:DNA-binding SARP family transcriptional activator
VRPFRYRPPDPGVSALLRPRLLAALLRRFEQRVVAVVAPAGFGKTTLLAQAVAENALAPRGVDAWLTCEPADTDRPSLLDGIAGALGAHDAELEAIVAAVWARSPVPVALLIDDAHEIGAGTPGAALLDALAGALPDNGHLVVAARPPLPLRLGRLLATGQATILEAEDLVLDGDERHALADLLGADAAVIESSGGWPALARLAAAAGHAVAERFVWEEVLDRLGDETRRILAVLSAVGGGDRELAEAAVGRPADLDAALAGVPLVARRDGPGGRWYVAHDLWRPLLERDLDPPAAAAARRRAAAVRRARGELREAGDLLLADPVDHEAWPEVAALFVAGAGATTSLTGSVPVEAWLAAIPPERSGEPEVRLLTAVAARLRGRRDAATLLQQAWDAARAQDRLDAELAAMSHLSHLAWWAGDAQLFATLFVRAQELEATGHPSAATWTAIGSALIAETTGDAAAGLAHLDAVAGPLAPAPAAVADWLRVRFLIALGRSAEAIPIADQAAARPGALPAVLLQPLSTRWQAARVEEVMTRLPTVEPDDDALPRDRLLANLQLATAAAYLGRDDEATTRLADATAHAGTVEGTRPRLLLGAVRAAVDACRGNEEAARAAVAELIYEPAAPLLVRGVMPVLAVVEPALRPAYDAEPLGPDHAANRDAARALIAARAGTLGPPIPDPPRVLVALGVRLAAELAARRDHADLAGYLLATCGPEARSTLRDLAAALPGARRLLRRVPAPPGHTLHIRVLGPPLIEYDGVASTRPEWGRERVRSLLCWLVARRRASRAETEAALWPDLDGVAAGANLRTTLGYLQRVLEPGRDPGEAPFFVRGDADVLALAQEHVTVDAWELERLLGEAAAAESAGAPSRALAAYEAATALWGGDYLAGVYDDWAGPERDRLRARFLAASVRAGELLLAIGAGERALALATRAIEAEPWSEPGHRLVIAAHLARGDRAAARRALTRCHAALDDLGVEPEEATVMLERAVLGPPG